MSYTKQTWNTGDIITAAKLNHMEDGIGNSMQFPENVYFVNLTNIPGSSDFTCDKTFSEIVSAYSDGYMIYGNYSVNDLSVAIVPLDAMFNDDYSAITYFSHAEIVSYNPNSLVAMVKTYSITEIDDVTMGSLAIAENIMGLPFVSGANGTYVLKATKTNSGVTYSWVADS